jgi:hypothetical protein
MSSSTRSKSSNSIPTVENNFKRLSNIYPIRKSTSKQLEEINLTKRPFSPVSLQSDNILSASINNSPVHNDYKFLFILFFLSNLWSLLFTSLPVIMDIPPDLYSKYKDWYTGNDIMRLLDPVGNLLINFYIFMNSGIFNGLISTTLIETTIERKKEKFIIIFIFIFGIACAQQGAAFHSASNMFKNSMQSIPELDDVENDIYFWMRTVWEHGISHYMYAIGLSIMHFSILASFRHHETNTTQSNKMSNFYLVIGAVTYACLMTTVAADFPWGLATGLSYMFIYGILGVGGYSFHLYHTGQVVNMFQLGKGRPVIQWYLLSYTLSIIFVFLYVLTVGGFIQLNQTNLVK